MMKKSIKYLRIVLNPVAFERERAKLQASVKKKDRQIQKKDSQIEALRGKVEKKDSQIGALRGKVEKKDSQIEALGGEKAELQFDAQKKNLKLALKQYAAGDLKAAEAFLEQVPSQDPVYRTALPRFARVAMKRKDWSTALKCLEAQLASQQDDVSHTLAQMSVAYRNQGMVDEAIDLLLSAQERGLSHNTLRFQLAKLFAEKMEWNKAADLLGSIIAEDEDFFREMKPAEFAARVFWRVGDVSKASTVIEHAMARNDAGDIPPRVRAIADEIRRYSCAPSKSHGPEVSKTYYDDIYKDSQKYSEEGERSVYSRVWDEIVARIDKGRHTRILDIGCGPGQFAEYLLQRCPSIEYTGVDFSRVAIDAAKKRCPPGTFVEADLFQTDILDEGEYDLVVALEVLEHLEDDLAVLGRIPAGKDVIFSVPNFDSFGHVRFFPTVASVDERYASLFVDCVISPVKLGERSVIFLALGVKK